VANGDPTSRLEAHGLSINTADGQAWLLLSLRRTLDGRLRLANAPPWLREARWCGSPLQAGGVVAGSIWRIQHPRVPETFPLTSRWMFWGRTRISAMRNPVDIDRTHSFAIVREIGERLNADLKDEPEVPVILRRQINRLRELEDTSATATNNRTASRRSRWRTPPS